MELTRRAAAFTRCALLLALAAACTDQPLSPRPDPAGADAPSLSIGVAAALSASITGPSYMQSGLTRTWQANASGGTGTYTYKWQYRAVTSTTWSYAGAGSSYTRSVPFGAQSFYLRVTVTSGGASAYDDHYVEVERVCGDYIC